MASELYVETLKGLTSGANANKIVVPSGQTLDVSAGGFTPPAGNVIQVVQTEIGASGSGTSTTVTSAYVATGHTAVITTTLANSKIYARFDAQGYQVSAAGSNFGLQRKIGAGSNTRLIGVDGGNGDAWLGFGNGTPQTTASVSRSILDTPNQPAGTELTYEVLLGHWSTSGTSFYGYTTGYEFKNTITLMEIAG